MKLTKVTATSKSTLTVSDTVFAAPVNDVLLAQAIRVYLSNKRQGTSKVKTRGEIIRTKKKWYKQKGTGNARHGARSANIFVGGGVAHGPKGNENWSRKLTPVLKKKALISALSVQGSEIVVYDEIMNLTGKTRDAARVLNKLAPNTGKILVIIDKTKEDVLRSLRNIDTVLVVTASRVNALEIAMADKIIATSEAIKSIEARLEFKKANKIVAKTEAKKETEKPEVKKTSEKKTEVKKETKKAVAKKAPKAKATKKVAAKKTEKK